MHKIRMISRGKIKGISNDEDLKVLDSYYEHIFDVEESADEIDYNRLMDQFEAICPYNGDETEIIWLS